MQVNALKLPTYLLQLGCVTLIKLFEVIISNNCCVATGLTCEELWVVCEDFDRSNSLKAGPPSSLPERRPTPAVVFTW